MQEASGEATAQKAAIAVEMLPLLEAEAKERQRRAAEIPNGTVKEKIPEASKGQARDKAAAATGVNPRYVSDAKKIKEESPERSKRIVVGRPVAES